jgi:hypothetical protein
MASESKKRQKPLEVTYARLEAEDADELRRREETTGAPMAAQIRILVHQALQAQRKRRVQ